MTGEHAAETPNKIVVSPAARKAIYALASALGALLVIYGLVTPEQVNAWLEVIGQALIVLTTLLALVNTPKKQ